MQIRDTAGCNPALRTEEISPTPGGTGIGLTNLRARLETLYGARQKLELAPRPEGGVIVRLEIPWHSVAFSETPGDGDPA